MDEWMDDVKVDGSRMYCAIRILYTRMDEYIQILMVVPP